ncbi:biofilm formation regulator BssR [Salmonella enterica]
MTIDEITRRLLYKLIAARIDLVAYVQRRKAQGYVSTSENDRLRESYFALAKEIRDKGERLDELADNDARGAIRRAGEALSTAAVCMMGGRQDCPTYITVNVDQLERSLNALDYSIHYLSEHSPLEEA